MGKKRRHRGFYGMRKRKNAEVYEDLHSDMDGTFAFIAGYTSGGAPYGVTWEEVGIDSNLPFEEKFRRYNEQIENGEAGIGTEVLEIEDDLGELPFEEEHGAF